MVPKLQYKYIEQMKFESIKSQNQEIIDKEITKKPKNIDTSKQRHHYNRSLSTNKTLKITIKRPSNINSSPKIGISEEKEQCYSIIKIEYH